MSDRPAVSVLMAVHDGLPFVTDAVRSLLSQTLADLEVVVIDDASTDGSAAAVEALGDPRVVVVRRPRAGLTRSLNDALGVARAPLIGRLDADDLSMPQRLARQSAFLAAHPEVGLLGTAAVEIDAEGRSVGLISPPTDDAGLRRALIRRNPLVHSSVVMRRELVERVGRYDESFVRAQDYDLWLRLSVVTRLASLPEPLVARRLLPGRVSVVDDGERLRGELRARWRAVGAGSYPRWCAIFAVRPLLALALPRGARRLVRAARAAAR